MPSLLLRLPVPPSRDPAARERQVPKAVRRRYEAFLERVRTLRTAKRLSQASVAKLMGVSTSHYANIERGHSVPTVARLFVLADALGTTAVELVGTTHRMKGGRKLPA